MPVPALRRATRFRLGAVLALGLVCTAAGGAAQPEADALPFGAGEVLRYRAVSSRFGTVGRGTLRVEGPEQVRGQTALRLCFDFQGRVGPVKVSDHSRSWLVQGEMTSLRYEREERSPLGARREAVEILPAEQRWTSAAGPGGQTPTLEPLDELSFLYFVRSLPLREGESHTLIRHFDPERNPVLVRVIGRERTTVPAGSFSTVVVEMRVRDRRVLEGDGTMRLYLTDDARRIPVRIDSAARWVGSTSLLLEATGADGAARP